MKEELFYLDGKGIFPRDSYSKEDYIRVGNIILQSSYSDDFLRIATKAIPFQKVQYDGKINKKILEKLKKRFLCDASWIRSFRGHELNCSGRFAHIIYAGQEIPVIIRGPWFASKSLYLHELIHVVRFNLDLSIKGKNAFEETYADKFYLIKDNHGVSIREMFKCWSTIRKAEKKLEDIVGDYKEYVSIRLNEKETRYIADTSKIDVKEYLKSQKTLRHNIMLERLGL